MTDLFLDNPDGWKFPFYDSQITPIKGRLVVDVKIMVGDTELADSHQITVTPESDIDYLRCKMNALNDFIYKI